MKCPNCDDYAYSIGSECPSCRYYEKPEYWDLGYCTIRIESRNWAVTYNGHVVEQEFASERDAQDKASSWETEMQDQYREHAYNS